MSECSDVDGADEFHFESDHLALKENKDYRVLLKTILTLQVQRTQAIQVKPTAVMLLYVWYCMYKTFIGHLFYFPAWIKQNKTHV